MITERLMAPGSWSLTLDTATDLSIRNKLVEYGWIVVTPTRLDTSMASDATILSLARYVGVLLQRASSFELDGAGLAWYLGAEDGVGDLLESPVTGTAASLSTWLTAVLPAAITSGTVTNAGTSTLSWTAPAYINRAQAVNYVCAAVGAEWRVRNDGTLDAAVPATLFNVTPNDIVLRKDGGPDGAVNGLNVDLLTEGLDASNYTTKVIVVGQGTGPTATTVNLGSASNSTSYKDLHGNSLIVKRVVDSPSTTGGTTPANTVAQATLNLFSGVKRPVSLSTDTYDIGRYVKPGDYLYVYDQTTGLVDATGATQVVYRGELLAPTTLRVYAITWPVEQGMGVYYRDSAGNYTELTQWVTFETGQATNYEVGDFVRLSSPSLELSPASAAVVTRAGGITATSYTPTLTATTANPTMGSGSVTSGSWWYDGSEVVVDINIAFGTSGAAAGTGFYRVALPVAPFGTSAGTRILGHGYIFDASAATPWVVEAYDAGSTTAGLIAYTGFVTAAYPFTWANNDGINLRLQYRWT